MKMKEENEKSGLKLNGNSKNYDPGIPSHHFMANRWGKNEIIYFGHLSGCCELQHNQ